MPRHRHRHQSEAERQRVRRKLIANTREIQENEDKAYDPTQTFLDDKVQEGTRLFTTSVTAPKEAVLDGEFVIVASKAAAKQASTLTDAFREVTWKAVTKGVRKRFSSNGSLIDWASLGKSASVYFWEPPSIQFMHGPLGVSHVRKQRQRRVKDTTRHKEIKPDEVIEKTTEEGRKHEALLSEELDEVYAAAVRARVVRPMPAGHERISSATNQPLPLLGFYETLLDPSPTDGFSKSVENMFYFSVLIKDGKAYIDYDADGLPVFAPVGDRFCFARAGVASNSPPAQLVVNFDMDDWRDLCKALAIRKPVLQQWRGRFRDDDTDSDGTESDSSEESSESEEDDEYDSPAATKRQRRSGGSAAASSSSASSSRRASQSSSSRSKGKEKGKRKGKARRKRKARSDEDSDDDEYL